MTSIMRENTNISKKQLDFLELLNADAAADAMLKETQLTDPTMGNSKWYAGILSSEQSRHFSTSQTTSSSQLVMSTDDFSSGGCPDSFIGLEDTDYLDF